jgi:hypothetical protein
MYHLRQQERKPRCTAASHNITIDIQPTLKVIQHQGSRTQLQSDAAPASLPIGKMLSSCNDLDQAVSNQFEIKNLRPRALVATGPELANDNKSPQFMLCFQYDAQRRLAPPLGALL